MIIAHPEPMVATALFDDNYGINFSKSPQKSILCEAILKYKMITFNIRIVEILLMSTPNIYFGDIRKQSKDYHAITTL